jgi:acyl carrier protein
MTPLTLNDIINELNSFVKENILDHSVSFNENMTLNEIGVDSVSIIQIVLFIERKYGVPMTENDLTQDNLRSIKSLAFFTIKSM